MRKYSCILVISTSLVYSCGTKSTAVTPFKLLPKETMQAVLQEFITIEAAQQHSHAQNMHTAFPKESLYRNALLKNKITKKEWVENWNYYSQDPTKMVVIYEKILLTMTTKPSS